MWQSFLPCGEDLADEQEAPGRVRSGQRSAFGNTAGINIPKKLLTTENVKFAQPHLWKRSWNRGKSAFVHRSLNVKPWDIQKKEFGFKAILFSYRKTVVCPIIDVISDDTFEYMAGSDMTYGGFNWKLNFRWYPVPQREMDRRKGDRTLPVR